MGIDRGKRARRLAAAIAERGWDGLAAFGSAGRDGYVRYVAGFAPEKGDALALASQMGETFLLLEDAEDRRRASGEQMDLIAIHAPDLKQRLADHLGRLGNCRKIGFAAPAGHPLPSGTEGLEDASAVLDALLAEETPADT